MYIGGAENYKTLMKSCSKYEDRCWVYNRLVKMESPKKKLYKATRRGPKTIAKYQKRATRDREATLVDEQPIEGSMVLLHFRAKVGLV